MEYIVMLFGVIERYFKFINLIDTVTTILLRL